LPFAHFGESLVAHTWLITGSSRGIGRALAEAVLAPGDNLVATARNVSGLEALTAPFGDRAMIVPLAVAKGLSQCALAWRVSPLGRFGQPEDIARVAVFLDSDEAGWLTGEFIFANGGNK
jgi:NAD(P)-dependent dehydrogenase (short-subunit alcohol dehydrogenase family)